MIDPAQLSKLVSYALRHRPWQFELELDPDGWVPVEQLVDALRCEAGYADLQAQDIADTVAAGPRRRHELHDGRIRALYGHSVAQRIEHAPEPEPGVLFHGTARDALAAIRRDGLLPRRRQYVHLATRPDLARLIGARRDPDPVVLEIDGRAAAADGVRFFRASDEIVLADSVPPAYLREVVTPA